MSVGTVDDAPGQLVRIEERDQTGRLVLISASSISCVLFRLKYLVYHLEICAYMRPRRSERPWSNLRYPVSIRLLQSLPSYLTPFLADIISLNSKQPVLSLDV